MISCSVGGAACVVTVKRINLYVVYVCSLFPSLLLLLLLVSLARVGSGWMERSNRTGSDRLRLIDGAMSAQTRAKKGKHDPDGTSGARQGRLILLSG